MEFGSVPSLEQPPVDEIDRRRREVVDKFYEFKTSLHSRKSKLESTKQFIQFKRLVDELITWVEDRFRILQELSFQDVTNLSTKRQKLQTFEVEINAHQEVLSKLYQVHASMKGDRYFMSDKAFECYQIAESQYSDLRRACQNKKEEIETLCEKLQYIGEANELLHTISIKLEEAESANFGKNMDEVSELQNTFKTFYKVWLYLYSLYSWFDFNH